MNKQSDKQQRELNAFKNVFGKEGARTEDQKIVWGWLISKILMKSRVENEFNQTARDIALDILDKVTTKPKDNR